MIVSCPTCSTHYSHGGESALEMGRCSRCDTRFPLSGQKRRYVVMPAVPADTPDPLLAAGAAEQIQLDLPAEPTGPPTREMPDEPFGPEPVELPGPSAREGDDAEDDGFFGAGMDDDEALFGIEEDGPLDGAETSTGAGPTVVAGVTVGREPRHPIREAFGVFLLAGLGAAAGFHGSTEFGFQPQNAVAVGLGVGLTLSWAWIRWAERKH